MIRQLQHPSDVKADSAEKGPEVLALGKSVSPACNSLVIALVLRFGLFTEIRKLFLNVSSRGQGIIILGGIPDAPEVGIRDRVGRVEFLIPADRHRRIQEGKAGPDQQAQNQEEYLRLPPQRFPEAEQAADTRCRQQAENVQEEVIRLSQQIGQVQPQDQPGDSPGSQEDQRVDCRFPAVLQDPTLCRPEASPKPRPAVDRPEDHGNNKDQHRQEDHAPLQHGPGNKDLLRFRGLRPNLPDVGIPVDLHPDLRIGPPGKPEIQLRGSLQAVSLRHVYGGIPFPCPDAVHPEIRVFGSRTLQDNPYTVHFKGVRQDKKQLRSPGFIQDIRAQVIPGNLRPRV